ncbi:ADP-ribosylation factor-like protein 8B [Thelohanellus kitauei]|uniref:ADP-ribosylation factor-like protein 8B n=1 Tax=Thelohanellus kitauei TaxID=669202 RepID=A0A0C2MVT6_THEKT|nr:ADP-ribosylation factor-like protein 8B [Thelohanellus kitauei]
MLAFFKSIWDWILSLLYKQEMEVTLVGLQSSGKSTFCAIVMNDEFRETTIPTTGFSVKKCKKGNCMIKFWDVGGQPRFRQLWDRYCRGVNCIIFMVDSADFEKLNQATVELNELMAKPALAGIPLLVLANKRDLPNALTDQEVITRMDLESIVNREVCCYSISCKDRTNIDVVVKWLINHATKPQTAH